MPQNQPTTPVLDQAEDVADSWDSSVADDGADWEQPFGSDTAEGTPATEDDDDALNLTIDLSVVEMPKFEVWGKGTYNAAVADVEIGKSKAGNNMVTWTFNVFHPDTNKTRKLKWYNTLDDNGKPRLKKAIQCIAPEITDLSKYRLGRLQEDCVSRECRVKLDIQRYEGSNRNNIQDVLPPNQEDSFLS